MNKISYEVETRNSPGGPMYALTRRGVRGGIRTVTVYTSPHVAQSVAHTLNSARSYETPKG